MISKKFARLREMVFFLLRMSALPYLIREMLQRRRVTILVYHKPSSEVADSHFAALRRRYNIVSMADYLKYRVSPSERLPRKALVVTLDDGHKSNYALKPIFEKHGIKATIFLCSGLAGTNRHFWFEVDMKDSVRQGLKSLGDNERLNALAGLGFSEATEQEVRQALSAAEIEEMKPIVDFQSHTVYHPVLPQCSEARSFEEISGSKLELETKFGLSIDALAYPNGDYSFREMEIAEKAGYKCALSLDSGFNSRQTPAFQLKRICITDDANIDELLVKASGLWGFLRRRRSNLTSSALSSAQTEQTA